MAHQPGQSVFRSILPEDIDWKPFPAFPPSVRLAVVVGEPSVPGPYTIRVKVPAGVKLMPHRHPEDRVYTVISGVFYIGLGDQFDGNKVNAYPPGSVIVLPGNTSHFHWAKSGEYVSQVTAIGPLGIEYLDPGDDPREQNQRARTFQAKPVMTKHTVGVEHIRIESAKSFADVRAALERNVPPLDPTLVKALADGDVERANREKQQGPELSIFGVRDHGPC
jgi:quercetin dioxygenase-like cupin family protein